MIIISFVGRNDRVPLTSQELQFIVGVTQKLLGEKLPKKLPLTLNCKIVNKKQILVINKDWRHKKQLSPIIAFPDYCLRLKNEPIEEEIHLGDMFICPEVLVQKLEKILSFLTTKISVNNLSILLFIVCSIYTVILMTKIRTQN